MAPDSAESAASSSATSTQNAQYDKIGTKYNAMWVLPCVEPEEPSVVAALGDIRGARCLELACGTGRYTHLLHRLGASSIHAYDISPTMIAGARASYPPESYPNISFAVADCSKPLDPPPPHPFDLIFAGWFLNYAGTEAELVSMFNVIRSNLSDSPDAKFVGITTNGDDEQMAEPKKDFYGMAVEVIDKTYREPGGQEVLGIKARVGVKEMGVQFECYQFRREVYERCAARAGLKLKWWGYRVPEDGRKEGGYWDRWLERPTFVVVEARRVEA